MGIKCGRTGNSQRKSGDPGPKCAENCRDFLHIWHHIRRLLIQAIDITALCEFGTSIASLCDTCGEVLDDKVSDHILHIAILILLLGSIPGLIVADLILHFRSRREAPLQHISMQ